MRKIRQYARQKRYICINKEWIERVLAHGLTLITCVSCINKEWIESPSAVYRYDIHNYSRINKEWIESLNLLLTYAVTNRVRINKEWIESLRWAPWATACTRPVSTKNELKALIIASSRDNMLRYQQRMNWKLPCSSLLSLFLLVSTKNELKGLSSEY